MKLVFIIAFSEHNHLLSAFESATPASWMEGLQGYLSPY
jgi:hypothetical protein